MKEFNSTSSIDMEIHYKLIENERLGDAPFCGALISAVDCKFNCKNCFNQNIKRMPTMSENSQDIIKRIKSNIFNKGIVLAGLEWTLQIDEAICLAKEARDNNLLTILYTGGTMLPAEEVRNAFDYIKVGRYVESERTANHIEYGVTLASKNQHIYKRGTDY